MNVNYFPPSLSKKIKTYYKRPFFDRLTGHYTVEWKGEKEGEIQVHLRFQDFQKNCPSLRSIMHLPLTLLNYASFQRSPLLANPLPYLVVDAVDFLDKIIYRGMKILELGGGNSTLWFLRRKVNLTTIEHSSSWAGYLEEHFEKHHRQFASSQWDLKTMEGEEVYSYLQNLEDQSLDLILVDCSNDYTNRSRCVEIGKYKIRRGGWMVLDNSDHPLHWRVVQSMSSFPTRIFTGYTTMGLTVSQTQFWQIV